MQFVYIDHPAALDDAVAELSREPILGVDTEAAGFHRYHDRITLVQVSSPARNFVIDPIAVPGIEALGPVLAGKETEKIFHDADFDLRILHRDLGFVVHRLFDTQIAAAFLGDRALGLAAVVEKYLGVSLPKAYQRADWAERPLPQAMLEYAAMDTAYLPPLRDRLLDELQRVGREHWAREEFERRESTRWEPTENADAFLRVKGARDLSPRGLAILREIYAWRERTGEERDQATFRILPNQSMIEIALRAPVKRRDLEAIPGMSTRLLERRGKDILAAVERALALPEAELPKFPPARRWERDPAAEERAERLRAARNQSAEELGLDPGFLISRAVLDDIARRVPESEEALAAIPEVRSWQIEALGPRLLAALHG